MIRIAIAGATGRMGKLLVETVLKTPDCSLVAAVTQKGNALVGTDCAAFLGEVSNVLVSDDPQELVRAKPDVLIDFSCPEATLSFLPLCAENNIALVIGTTGFSPEQRKIIEAASEQTPITLAANMSAGVNITMKLIAEAARLMPDYDCEIVEMHHNRKADAPSGTAIEMGHVVAKARGQKFEDVVVWARHGRTGPRVGGTIGFACLRGGDVIGDHRVIFAGPGERIEVAHLSSSRQGYATGAVKAAQYLARKESGFYTMADVLGL
jgi:4-hydroxy-tetrahydrodipicolinate reductase